MKRASEGKIDTKEYQELGVTFMLSAQQDAAVFMKLMREIRLFEIFKVCLFGALIIYIWLHT